VQRLLGPFAEPCGFEAGEAIFVGPESEIGPGDLTGAWFFEGAATECTGLAEADCADFFASFTSNVDIDCDVDPCTVRIATAAPSPVDESDEPLPLTAAGSLPDADGFSCDGAPDLTTWVVVIERIGIVDGEVGWTGRIELFSEDGSIDGNSCVEERVVAEGTARPA
jgi:hypothetical protein